MPIQLGVDLPVRMSGDIEGDARRLRDGAKRDAGNDGRPHPRRASRPHVALETRSFTAVKHLDRITLKVTSPDACNTRFDDLIVRVDPSFKLEVHMDTDEANACDLERATKVELIKT